MVQRWRQPIWMTWFPPRNTKSHPGRPLEAGSHSIPPSERVIWEEKQIYGDSVSERWELQFLRIACRCSVFSAYFWHVPDLGLLFSGPQHGKRQRLPTESLQRSTGIGGSMITESSTFQIRCLIMEGHLTVTRFQVRYWHVSHRFGSWKVAPSLSRAHAKPAAPVAASPD